MVRTTPEARCKSSDALASTVGPEKLAAEAIDKHPVSSGKGVLVRFDDPYFNRPPWERKMFPNQVADIAHYSVASARSSRPTAAGQADLFTSYPGRDSNPWRSGRAARNEAAITSKTRTLSVSDTQADRRCSTPTPAARDAKGVRS